MAARDFTRKYVRLKKAAHAIKERADALKSETLLWCSHFNIPIEPPAKRSKTQECWLC